MSFGRGGQAVPEDPYDNAIPDEDASKIVSDAAQFADLHNRIQSVNHHLSTIFRSIGQNAAVGEQRHAETATMIGDIKELLGRFSKLEVMEGRLRDIETEMRGMRQEMSGRLRDSENAIKYHVSDKHETLAQNVQAQTKSGHARLIWVVIGSQVVLVGGFVYYKRRKTSPKKYL
jgi:mannose-binding lectin 1